MPAVQAKRARDLEDEPARRQVLREHAADRLAVPGRRGRVLLHGAV
jgi:hypothetical protein